MSGQPGDPSTRGRARGDRERLAQQRKAFEASRPVPTSIAQLRRGPEDSWSKIEPTFAVAVSHCPWIPARAANMDRVQPMLRGVGSAYHEVTDRAPNHVWSRRMWGWGVQQLGATHVLFAQDDLRFHPDFAAVLRAMVRAVPNRVIALLGNHPMSERALAEGHQWYQLCEVLGAAYVFPRALLSVFLDWRDRHPARERWNEDFMVTLWLARTGRRAWTPIPSPIQTPGDEVIESTNPAEGRYQFRSAYVDWTDPRVAGDLTSVDYWRPGRTPPPDFGGTVQDDWRTRTSNAFAEPLVFAAHRRITRGMP